MAIRTTSRSARANSNAHLPTTPSDPGRSPHPTGNPRRTALREAVRATRFGSSWRGTSPLPTMASVLALGVALAGHAPAAAMPQAGIEQGSPAMDRRTSQRGKEIVFLDTQLEGYAQLVQALRPGAQVVPLDPGREGVTQIAEVLENRPGLSVVHIVSHGEPGRLRLGGGWLSVENLPTYREALARWFPGRRTSDEAQPELLLYACRLAEGQEGRQFVERLAEQTGARVAASDDLTGHRVLGGDWTLELGGEGLHTPTAFDPEAITNYPSVLATFVVTNLNDSGPGSLRQAIEDANDNPGADEIIFRGKGASGTIELESDLSPIYGPQSETDLTITGPGPDRLTISGGTIFVVRASASISGLAITNSPRSGIFAFDSRVEITDAVLTGNSNGVSVLNYEVHLRNTVVSKNLDDGLDCEGDLSCFFGLENSVLTGNGGFGINCAFEGAAPNFCSVSVQNSTLSGNARGGVNLASDHYGGAHLANIEHSTISGNGGDGIAANDGELLVMNSIISGNAGGGITDAYTGTVGSYDAELRVVNSTISGNGGAGISAFIGDSEAAILLNSTISGNAGIGIDVDTDRAALPLQNTIVADNSTDCSGPFTSLGNNLIGNPSDCEITLLPTDLTGNPRLGEFVDPGTPGAGHIPLLANSPAVDSANDEACSPTDQLGRPRINGDSDGTVSCDRGAVEFYPVVNDLVILSEPVATSFDATPAPNAPAGTSTISATFTNGSSAVIRHPFFQVAELTSDNLLLNSDGGAATVGATLTPDVGDDELLFPGESVTVEVQIGLQELGPFRLIVDRLGEPGV